MHKERKIVILMFLQGALCGELRGLYSPPPIKGILVVMYYTYFGWTYILDKGITLIFISIHSYNKINNFNC